MDLTVGKLKEIISQLPDDVLLADLSIGNSSFRTFSFCKRLLLLENKHGKRYLTINKMGSHFTGTGDQIGLTYIKTFDE